MQELNRSEEQIQMATATSVSWERFDFAQQMVVDGKTLTLIEAYATVRLIRAKTEEVA